MPSSITQHITPNSVKAAAIESATERSQMSSDPLGSTPLSRAFVSRVLKPHLEDPEATASQHGHW